MQDQQDGKQHHHRGRLCVSAAGIIPINHTLDRVKRLGKWEVEMLAEAGIEVEDEDKDEDEVEEVVARVPVREAGSMAVAVVEEDGILVVVVMGAAGT